MMTENQSTSEGKCHHLEHCNLIVDNKTRMPNLIKRIQSYYCMKLTSQCARRWIYDSLGKSFVPPLLLPNQWEWAREIICECHNADQSQVQDTIPADKKK